MPAEEIIATFVHVTRHYSHQGMYMRLWHWQFMPCSAGPYTLSWLPALPSGLQSFFVIAINKIFPDLSCFNKHTFVILLSFRTSLNIHVHSLILSLISGEISLLCDMFTWSTYSIVSQSLDFAEGSTKCQYGCCWKQSDTFYQRCSSLIVSWSLCIYRQNK